MRNSEDLNENPKNNWDYAGNCRNSEDVKINLKQQDNSTSGKNTNRNSKDGGRQQISCSRMQIYRVYLNYASFQRPFLENYKMCGAIK